MTFNKIPQDKGFKWVTAEELIAELGKDHEYMMNGSMAPHRCRKCNKITQAFIPTCWECQEKEKKNKNGQKRLRTD